MVRTQIYLTDSERRALMELSRQTGHSQSELIRRAIDAMLQGRQEVDRRALVMQAAGLWADRTDLPDLQQLRREWAERNVDAG